MAQFYDSTIFAVLEASDAPLGHSAIAARIAPGDNRAWAAIGVSLSVLYRAGVLDRERIGNKYRYRIATGPRPITDDQVRTAITVLRAYADGTLTTDLCDELDEALTAAWRVPEAEWADQELRGDYEYDEDQTLAEYHREIDGIRGD